MHQLGVPVAVEPAIPDVLGFDIERVDRRRKDALHRSVESCGSIPSGCLPIWSGRAKGYVSSALPDPVSSSFDRSSWFEVGLPASI